MSGFPQQRSIDSRGGFVYLIMACLVYENGEKTRFLHFFLFPLRSFVCLGSLLVSPGSRRIYLVIFCVCVCSVFFLMDQIVGGRVLSGGKVKGQCFFVVVVVVVLSGLSIS